MDERDSCVPSNEASSTVENAYFYQRIKKSILKKGESVVERYGYVKREEQTMKTLAAMKLLFEYQVEALRKLEVETLILTSQMTDDTGFYGSPKGLQFLEGELNLRQNFMIFCTGPCKGEKKSPANIARSGLVFGDAGVQLGVLVKALRKLEVDTLILTSQMTDDTGFYGSPKGLQFLEDELDLRKNFMTFCTGNAEVNPELQKFPCNVENNEGKEGAKVNSDIYYCCQNDDGDEPFEMFCRKFLSEFSVKHLKDQQNTPRRLLLVVNLPIDNRQNTIDVISGFITCIKRKYKLCDYLKICLIQISFDGNCSWNPPNRMNKTIVEALEKKVNLNLDPFIDIIFSDDYHFTRCDINEYAAKNIQSYISKTNLEK